jgi:hypothetical protein
MVVPITVRSIISTVLMIISAVVSSIISAVKVRPTFAGDGSRLA